jgi:hypothetical protein
LFCPLLSIIHVSHNTSLSPLLPQNVEIEILINKITNLYIILMLKWRTHYSINSKIGRIHVFFSMIKSERKYFWRNWISHLVMISPSQGLYLHTEQHKHRINAQNTDIHASSGIRNNDPSFRTSEDSSCLRPPRQLWLADECDYSHENLMTAFQSIYNDFVCETQRCSTPSSCEIFIVCKPLLSHVWSFPPVTRNCIWSDGDSPTITCGIQVAERGRGTSWSLSPIGLPRTVFTVRRERYAYTLPHPTPGDTSSRGVLSE